jgi:hypothetical protein
MTQNTNLPAPAPMMAGGQVAALIPQSLEEAFRVSKAIAVSGLAPRGIDKPEQIMVAIMAGAELGLAPFQSLQSFAVVNGRPTLWGDGLLAVVRGRGVRVKEWMEGEGDAMVAHCECTRPDTGETIPRTFSVADAKKATLWGKAGPWQQYPKRMLQMRARALSLRDGCADMLRGIQVREEVEDYQHVRDVTPSPPDLRARLEAKRAPATEGFTATQAEDAADFDQVTGEVIEGEATEHHEADGHPAGAGEAENSTAASPPNPSGEASSTSLDQGEAADTSRDDPAPPNQPDAGAKPRLTLRERVAVAIGVVNLQTTKRELEALRNSTDMKLLLKVCESQDPEVALLDLNFAFDQREAAIEQGAV